MNNVNYPLQTEESKDRMEKRLTEKEIKRILKRLEKRGLNKGGTWRLESFCHKAIIHMLIFCPIKASDLLNIKMNEYYIENEISYVIMKKEIEKKIYIPQSITMLIKEYLERRSERGHQSNYLFQSRLGEKMTDRGLLDLIRKVGNECKIENLNTSMLRQSYWYSLSKRNGLNENIKLLIKKVDIKHLFDLIE